MRHSVFFLLSLALILTCTAGCESLSTRLAENQQVLHSLPPENQDLIRQGSIKVGFSQQEVYLAWGIPNHKTTTESSRGSLETWIYTMVRTETYYSQRRIYDGYSERWRYIDKPYRVHSEYVVKEAVFLDGQIDSFTLFPSARPYR